MVTADTVRSIALSLPNVTEGISCGTPSFKINDKLLGRISENGASIVIYIDPEEREAWHTSDPKTFTVPDHYKNYNCIVVELDTAVSTLFARAWRVRGQKV